MEAAAVANILVHRSLARSKENAMVLALRSVQESPVVHIYELVLVSNRTHHHTRNDLASHRISNSASN
jgi:ribosomal protein L15E